MTRLILPGCRPEPLLSYLKALGIFRLVAEQKDPAARAAWENGVLVLHTTLSEAELVAFFINEYKPTPIVVPWHGDDFFKAAEITFTGKAVKGAEVIAAFREVKSPRLVEYQDAINVALNVLKDAGLSREKSAPGKPAKLKRDGKVVKKNEAQSLIIKALRSNAPEAVLPWIDATALLTDEGGRFFNGLLGKGGADGQTHFSDHFMQNLWDVLPDFNSQRSKKQASETLAISTAFLRNCFFDDRQRDFQSGRTPSLFDSGALGGANATQGMNREALTNPWNFIFCLEGALCMAGAASRRLNASRSGAAFPFTVRSRTVGSNTFSADKESGQWEVWLPLWSRPMTLAEMTLLFSEGRAEVKRKAARDGVDFSRAIASYGTDRGIEAFTRYAIVTGRIGGDNYNTAATLGQFVVSPLSGVDLLNDIDSWLKTVHRVCYEVRNKRFIAPARFRSAIRQLEEHIMDYCRYGGQARFVEVLCALGRMERELGRTGKKPGKVGISKIEVPPASLRSRRWLQAADDGSPEFRLAVALASIQGVGEKLGALRVHLEPVSQSLYKWDETSKMVVWTAGDLARNLAAVLDRRLMEAKRANVEHLPLEAKRFATPADVAAFIAGAVDDQRLEDLLWGAMLINWNYIKPYAPKVKGANLLNLPRAYALLKLLFLPEAQALPTANGRPLWPEASILAALRGGNMSRAAELAARRLRAAGYAPLVNTEHWSAAINPTRLAAALLIPLALPKMSGLDQLVIRQSTSTIE